MKQSQKYKILHLEDIASDAELAARELRGSIDFEHLVIDTEDAFVDALESFAPDLILCDHSLPSFNSLEALKIVRRKKLYIPFILITATMSEEVAASVAREGADDYILKDRLKRLPIAVLNSIEKYRHEKDRKLLIDEAREKERRAKEQLSSLSKKLLLATRVAGIGIWEYNFRTAGFTCDEITSSFLGLSSLAFQGSYQSLFQNIHPQDKARVRNEFKKAILHHVDFKTEFRSVQPDGTLCFIEAVSLIQRNKKGKPYRIIGTNRNITQQKKAELAIRESEEKYRSFFNNSMDAILLTITDGNIIAANPAACAVFGMTEEELCTRSCRALADPEDPCFESLINERQRTGSAKGEITMVRKSGAKFPAEISSMVFKDANGRLKTSKIIRDITGQVEARKNLENSEKKFRQIIETTEEGIWMIDEKNKTTFVNKKMCEILEYTEEEMLGKTNLDFKDEEEKKRALQQIERRKKGIKETHESTFITKSGRKICTLVSTNAVLDDDGNYKGALAMITDITQRKQLEEDILRQKVQQQKEITKAALLVQEKERNNLGAELHDNINQILTAVKLQLKHFIEHPDLPVSLVETSHRHLATAIEEIRGLSQNLVTHRFQDYSFSNVLDSFLTALPLRDALELNLSNLSEEKVPDAIKLTLFRIVQEHVNNIAKHAKATRVAIALCTDEAFVHLNIHDNGVGFEVKAKRSGVGLTNIYNRVESYSGRIDIVSRPGNGCRLSISIPLAQPLLFLERQVDEFLSPATDVRFSI